jgi:hypothetical protein
MKKFEKINKVVDNLLDGADFENLYDWSRMFLEDYYSSHDEDLEEEYEAISEGEDDE